MDMDILDTTLHGSLMWATFSRALNPSGRTS
jgi:hypothetical protein